MILVSYKDKEVELLCGNATTILHWLYRFAHFLS